jgi:hypothetical protein
MHQGKDGLAFVEAFLAQRSTSGRLGSGPSSRATSFGSTVPASSSKTGNKIIHQQWFTNYSVSFSNIIITCDLRNYF